MIKERKNTARDDEAKKLKKTVSPTEREHRDNRRERERERIVSAAERQKIHKRIT